MNHPNPAIVVRRFLKQADRVPPLGYPGGIDYLVKRIVDEVQNPRLEHQLVDKVETGEPLTNPEAAQVYSLDSESPPERTKFRKILIGPHAQYRMDLRGVTVPEIRAALSSWNKAYYDAKSRGESRYWEELIARGEGIDWLDTKQGLFIAFTIDSSGIVKIITTYWKGVNDPKVGYVVSPGVQTFVSPKSELNLPNNTDREPASALPPGSATPSSGRREIPGVHENKPGRPLGERNQRTVAVPGEEYGVPYKEDYGTPTRRTMTAFKRQRKRRGLAKIKAHRAYLKTRSRVLAKARIYRRRTRRSPKHLRTIHLYKMNPGAHHRFAWEAGLPTTTHQKNQPPRERYEEHRRYLKNKARENKGAKRRYHQFCKHNRQCLEKRENYREAPFRYKRKGISRDASYESAPEIGFTIDGESYEWLVEDISSDGIVSFIGGMGDLPVQVVLRVAEFKNERSLEDFYEWVDEVVDMDAHPYREAVPEDAFWIADLFGVFVPDSIQSLSTDSLEYLIDRVVMGDEGLARTAEGITFYMDRGSPANNEIKEPGKDVGYRAVAPNIYTNTPDEKAGVPAGHDLPAGNADQVSPASGGVVPDSMAFRNRNAMLAKDIISKTGPSVTSKATSLQVKLTRVGPKRDLWFFSVPGSKGDTYTVKVKAIPPKPSIKDVGKADVQISCNCNFFQWQGPEHWAKSNGYLYGKPVGTASKPVTKDPSGKNWLCKHAVAVLEKVSTYRFAAVTGLYWERDMNVTPHFDREALIRIAYQNPELRPVLLPQIAKMARTFGTNEALKKYLKDHPGADKAKHSVEKADKKPAAKDEKPVDNADAKMDIPPKLKKKIEGLPDGAKERLKAYDPAVVKGDLGSAIEIAQKLETGVPKGSDACKDLPSLCKGNLALKREEMPQIPGDMSVKEMLNAKNKDGTPDEKTRAKGKAAVDAGADPESDKSVLTTMLDQLKSTGVKIVKKKVPVGKLKATQSDILTEKTLGMADSYLKGKFPNIGSQIVISKDGHILDGHHRWAALRSVDPGREMDCIQVDMNMKDLLDHADGLPGVYRENFKGDPIDLPDHIKKKKEDFKAKSSKKTAERISR